MTASAWFFRSLPSLTPGAMSRSTARFSSTLTIFLAALIVYVLVWRNCVCVGEDIKVRGWWAVYVLPLLSKFQGKMYDFIL